MSDNDLIRRGDALKVADGEMRRYGFGLPGGRVEEMRNAISAIAAVQVGVKPLEWVDREDGGSFADTWHIWCEVFKVDRGFIATHCAVEIGTYDTLESAKAAAQADYDARIRSALTAQPSPDVAALVQAAEQMLMKIDTACLVERDHPQADLADAWRDFRIALARVKVGAA